MVFQMVARTAIWLCHAPALALVGWALISPPMINTDVDGQVDIGAPVSEWNIVGEGSSDIFVDDCTKHWRAHPGAPRTGSLAQGRDFGARVSGWLQEWRCADNKSVAAELVQ